jgi:glucose/mannose-6-phosphate isomerase
LPGYVDSSTLVIASSYSGNTEETVSVLAIAKERGAETAVVTSGGKLLDIAQKDTMCHVILPSGLQPRVAVFYSLRGIIALLANFGIVTSITYDEIARASEWLGQETANWLPSVGTAKNYAKQLALLSVGKTAVFYGGSITAPVAYKWKISWNENAKNVSFYNQYPEFNHNEFIGWTSHPIEKPFIIFDIVSSFENRQVLKRFEISDRLLSGQRPKANTINLSGDTILKQLLWGSVLADFTSIYLSILNGVDPTPVPLIEKLKQEL